MELSTLGALFNKQLTIYTHARRMKFGCAKGICFLQTTTFSMNRYNPPPTYLKVYFVKMAEKGKMVILL